MRLDEFASDEFSQFGEDGMIAKIFSLIGEGARTCVEFGAADGSSCSNTRRLWQGGWNALLAEGDPGLFQNVCITAEDFSNVSVVNVYLTPTDSTSIDAILQRSGIMHVDFMSIDVDGIDYQIWEAMTIQPRVICIEYNQSIPPHVAVHQRRLDDCLGSSAKALVELGKSKGYEFIGMNKANLFFVVASEVDSFNEFERDLMHLFPYENLSYAASDYRGRPFILGELPWGMAEEPYIGETVGDPIQILGSVADLIETVKLDSKVTAVTIGQDWEVSPSAITDIGVRAYKRLFRDQHPMVILDVANLADLNGCQWVTDIAAKCGYSMRIVRKDLLVFER